MNAEIQPLYTDDHLLLLDKPSGLLSVPGRGPDKQDCLSTRLQRDYPEALIVHRLDRDTSGLMLFARDAETHRRLSGQFERREVAKQYMAVVQGVVECEEGRIELPLRKCFERPPRHRVDHEQGKPAVTNWQALGRDRVSTRMLLHPLTGRSHQLRIHMQQLVDAGGCHPILGDPLYGSSENADRLMLHATRLELAHPATGKPIVFESACPF